MKRILYILVFLVPVQVFAQKTLKNFRGTILLKNSSYQGISREHWDTIISYYSFYIDSLIEINEGYPTRDDAIEYSFIEFKFTKQGDSLFIHYHNPVNNKNESAYIYPLNHRDTLSECEDYKILVDSFPLQKQNGPVEYKKTLDPTYAESARGFKIIYVKDTIIKFQDYQFDCYMIEQVNFPGRDASTIRRNIFIDKESLIPVHEDEFTYPGYWARAFLKRDTWTHTSQMRIVMID